MNTNNENTSNATAIDKREQNAMIRPEPMEQGTYYTPLCDIAETPEAFLFQADLPGAKPDTVDISFENGTLTIQSKVPARQTADTRYVWREYGVGHFYRSFSLSTPVNADGIKAELKNGALSLYVPKAESAKTRKIQIQTS